MLRTIIFLCFSLFAGCTNKWLPHGDSSPKDYDIKVVVYRDALLESIEKKYPVDSKQEKDFRYLEYQAALIYLDEKINENVIESTTNLLKETKALLIEKLSKRE